MKNLFLFAQQREIILYACESHGDLLEYLNALDLVKVGQFKCSVPRHEPYILKYKVPKINLNNLKRKENLPLWMLFHQDQNLSIQCQNEIRTFPVSELEWLIYHDKPALQHLGKRIYEISVDEPIV